MGTRLASFLPAAAVIGLSLGLATPMGCEYTPTKADRSRTETRAPEPAGKEKDTRLPLARPHALLRVTRLDGRAQAVAFSPDGQSYGLGLRWSPPRVYDANTSALKHEVPGDYTHTQALAFSPDSKTMAFSSVSGFASNNPGVEIRFWGLRSRRFDLVIPEAKPANALAFSPDGKLLASGVDSDAVANPDQPGSVSLWNACNGELVATSKEKHVCNIHLGFSPDGKKMVAAGQNCGVAVWDVATRKTLKYREFENQLSAQFTPDSRTLLVSGQGKIWTWDLATNNVREKQLADVPTEQEIHAFSPDGRWLAGGVKMNDTGEKLIIAVWDVATGKRVAAWGHQGFRENGGEEISALAFSPDSTKLLTISTLTEIDGNGPKSRSEIRLWDVAKLANSRK